MGKVVPFPDIVDPERVRAFHVFNVTQKLNVVLRRTKRLHELLGQKAPHIIIRNQIRNIRSSHERLGKAYCEYFIAVGDEFEL